MGYRVVHQLWLVTVSSYLHNGRLFWAYSEQMRLCPCSVVIAAYEEEVAFLVLGERVTKCWLLCAWTMQRFNSIEAWGESIFLENVC